MQQYVDNCQQKLNNIKKHLPIIKNIIAQQLQQLNYNTKQLHNLVNNYINRQYEHLYKIESRMQKYSPDSQIIRKQILSQRYKERLFFIIITILIIIIAVIFLNTT